MAGISSPALDFTKILIRHQLILAKSFVLSYIMYMYTSEYVSFWMDFSKFPLSCVIYKE
jgi:hypothetical protein